MRCRRCRRVVGAHRRSSSEVVIVVIIGMREMEGGRQRETARARCRRRVVWAARRERCRRCRRDKGDGGRETVRRRETEGGRRSDGGRRRGSVVVVMSMSLSRCWGALLHHRRQDEEEGEGASLAVVVVVVAALSLSLSLRVGEARMGEMWARRYSRRRVVIVACEGGWVRTRDR